MECPPWQAKGSGGARGYLAISGGLDVPLYLGSRSTFPGGVLGGVQVPPPPPPPAPSLAPCPWLLVEWQIGAF